MVCPQANQLVSHKYRLGDIELQNILINSVLHGAGSQVVDGSSRTDHTQASVQNAVSTVQELVASGQLTLMLAEASIEAGAVSTLDAGEPCVAQVAGL